MRTAVVVGMLLTVSLLAPLWLPAGQPGPTNDQPAATVEELVRRLGSKRFRERDEAMRRLVELEVDVSTLRPALESPDREMVRRAGLVLEGVANRKRGRMLGRLGEYAKVGAVDRFAELVARWPVGWEEEFCWRTTYNLAVALFKFCPKPKEVPSDVCLDFLAGKSRFPCHVVAATRVTNLRTVFDEFAFFFRGQEVCFDGSHYGCGAFVCSGPVHIKDGIGFGAVFAAGPVDVEGLSCTVVVADDDITIRDGPAGLGARYSLVISRGTVTCCEKLTSCHIVAGKKIIVTRSKQNETSRFTEGEQEPFGFVRYFDPTREGVTVEAANGGVRVRAADVAKPFAKAGLKAGDLITAVNGAVASDPEAFRRLLRRAIVADNGLTLRVLRRQNPGCARAGHVLVRAQATCCATGCARFAPRRQHPALFGAAVRGLAA